MITLSTSNQAGLANQASSAQRNTAKSIETISSGSRLSRASSDIASFSIASRLKAEIIHNDQAIRNAADAQSLLHTADSGLGEIQAILQELRSVSVQSMNGTYSSTDTASMNTHAQQLLAEIDSIASSTKWAGSGLLDGNSAYLKFKTGEAASSSASLTACIPGFKSANLGLSQLTLNGSDSHINGLEVADEFQVNSGAVLNAQINPSITALNNGNFLVVWESNEYRFGFEQGLFGQILDSDGNTIGSEFQLYGNGNNGNLPGFASVNPAADGGFMLTFQHRGIYGRKFDSVGNQQGSTATFATYSSSTSPGRPDSAVSTGGSGLTVWNEQGADGEQAGIVGQRFDSDGSPIDSVFQINTVTLRNQQSAKVASLSDGGYIVTWRSEYTGGVPEIAAQRLDASGNKVGSEFQVNTTSVGSSNAGHSDPARVKVLSNGHTVITWSGADGSIYAQRYDKDMGALGDEIKVSDGAEKGGTEPEITSLAGNDFLISWAADDTVYPGYIFGQRYNACGEAQGDTFSLITDATAGTEDRIAAFANASGDVLMAWTNEIDNSSSSSNLTRNVNAQLISPYGKGETSKLNMIDDAIAYVVQHRAALGANINRLSSAISNLTTLSQNKKASLGTVADADMATEVTQLAKTQLLAQASVAMTAQANKSMYEVLKLIND